MSILQAIILGIVQGLTEFIPVSSSGHLALGKLFFGLEEEGLGLLFIVVVHVGTLVPVFVVFRKEIWALIRRPFQKTTFLLIVATIPAVITGLLLEDRIEQALSTLSVLAIGFVLTGGVLILSDKMRQGTKKEGDITWLDAALIGIAQAVAVFPGISRSGSTISAALARGITREDAAKFVFLMSIPVILGATVLQIIHIARGNISAYELDFAVLGAGFVSSALSGYLAVNFLLAAIKKKKLRYFAYYVLVLAAVLIFGMIAFNW